MNLHSSILYNKRAAYVTLGCKLNYAETSSLRDRLCALGVKDAADGEQADFCIVNTCSVTDVADHKCRQTIHRFTREHPGAFVVVMGCYAQLKAEEIAAFEGSAKDMFKDPDNGDFTVKNTALQVEQVGDPRWLE